MSGQQTPTWQEIAIVSGETFRRKKKKKKRIEAFCPIDMYSNLKSPPLILVGTGNKPLLPLRVETRLLSFWGALTN